MVFRISVCIFPSRWYFRNCNEMIGINKLHQDALEKIYPLVAVQANIWFALPEDEKHSFLLNELQSKL